MLKIKTTMKRDGEIEHSRLETIEEFQNYLNSFELDREDKVAEHILELLKTYDYKRTITLSETQRSYECVIECVETETESESE
jgi:hypothetical protein